MVAASTAGVSSAVADVVCASPHILSRRYASSAFHPWLVLHRRHSQNEMGTLLKLSYANWLCFIRDASTERGFKAPVVVVGVILLVAAIVIIARKGWHSRMAQWSTNAASAFGPSTNGTTELTAQQLAGDMAGGAGAPTIGAGRSRRRGNRRTPSQISTRSLPVYMKEPGEHEVVIYRCVSSYASYHQSQLI